MKYCAAWNAFNLNYSSSTGRSFESIQCFYNSLFLVLIFFLFFFLLLFGFTFLFDSASNRNCSSLISNFNLAAFASSSILISLKNSSASKNKI